MFLLIVGTYLNAMRVGIKIIVAIGKPYAALVQLQHIFIAVFGILANASYNRCFNAYGLQMGKFINQVIDILHLVNFGKLCFKRIQSLLFNSKGIHAAKIKITYFLSIAPFFGFGT